ncbi:activated RNA polymerase II transcriptional coactivator p15-like isoform X2 [Crassostrea virginica]|uniref:Activated RNA polymerase II transcriptional coactivator p15-like n=1 Tax=Crassostrea virginica TaxID=6565 RepID=A0A8B8E2T4_CRAVI|nr:activated RNA polymerase II transcriptional coactivator p15-like [Crassostrea virginica]XP_022333594.1 activated RNA polymerase II transcriptional coactivator p15-like [Crassostrea virginica]
MPKSKEFISSSESDSDSDQPKQKKLKVEKKVKKESKKEEKKETSSSSKGPGGEHMFQLSKMRFATVSEFRGNVMVGIREFYDAGGELRPGKKGISLTKEQWTRLKEQIDEIDDAVKEFS